MKGIFFTGTVAFSIPLQQLLSFDAFWKGPKKSLDRAREWLGRQYYGHLRLHRHQGSTYF